MVFDSNGDLYFTDPNFGFKYETFIPFISDGYECQDCASTKNIYRVKSGSNDIELVANIEGMPNGIGISPDETRLYVADISRSKISVFENPKTVQIPL